MRPVTWLHISDLHLRESASWSQDGVLSRMLDDIRRRSADGLVIDFVLVTGDLAFSGEESQYHLVEAFLDDLAATLHLSASLIYCVPGNHDVQRDTQTMCFKGARQSLHSENDVYAFLQTTAERETLLARQANYFSFQERYSSEQERESTTDRLGYVSTVSIDDLRIAIVGLNSAWLAEGGVDDERQLLLGEHQVENALAIAKRASTDLVVSMQHHPFDFLRRFDKSATKRSIENACDIVHFGHLHETQVSQAVSPAGSCLILGAGAAFDSRSFRNAYSIIQFDPLRAKTDVTFCQYDPTDGHFSYVSESSHRTDGRFSSDCAVGELADAVACYVEESVSVPHYIAAILLEVMHDVPIETASGVTFAANQYLVDTPETPLQVATTSLLTVGRAVKLLYSRKPLTAILHEHGEPLVAYCAVLRRLCDTVHGLSAQLLQRNQNAIQLDGGSASAPYAHGNRFANTLELLSTLRHAEDWEQLEELAERHATATDPLLSAKATRCLALCLSRASEAHRRLRAIALYRDLTTRERVEAEDWAGLATLLTDNGDYEAAKTAVRTGIRSFPRRAPGFTEVGMRIVEETGDKAFRQEMRGRTAAVNTR